MSNEFEKLINFLERFYPSNTVSVLNKYVVIDIQLDDRNEITCFEKSCLYEYLNGTINTIDDYVNISEPGIESVLVYGLLESL